MCLVGQGSPAWLGGRGHGQSSSWGLCRKLRAGTVGCNGELQPARVLHIGVPPAFGLASLGKCLLFLELQLDTLSPSCFSPSSAC